MKRDIVKAINEALTHVSSSDRRDPQKLLDGAEHWIDQCRAAETNGEANDYAATAAACLIAYLECE